jgi:hypothetical protein
MIPNGLETTMHYQSLGTEELHARRDALAYEMADLPGLYGVESAPVAALLIEPWLRAAEAELARRQRLYASGADVPDPNAARYDAWRDMAREVREQANIVSVFDRGGYDLRQTGRHEWHGQCFVCGGGVDRLMVRTDPPSRYWCRQCGLTGDAISAARTLHDWSFFEAVRDLAAETGLVMPVEPTTKDAELTLASGAVLAPVRGGGRRRGR